MYVMARMWTDISQDARAVKFMTRNRMHVLLKTVSAARYIGCVLYSADVGPRSFRAGLPIYRGALPKLTQRCSTSFVPAYGRRILIPRVYTAAHIFVRQLRKTAAQAFLPCSLERQVGIH